MKNKKLTALITTFLSFAMLTQSGFVMPAYAAGTDFSLYANYQEEREDGAANSRLSERHPIILPGGANSYNRVSTFSATTPYTFNPTDPHRIVGYTFMGWKDKNGSGGYNNSFNVGEPIEDSQVPSNHQLYLYGVWELYKSPFINSGTVQFDRKNTNGEETAEDITWVDGSNNPTTFNFDKDTTDYTGYVYSEVSSTRMRFEQYEPDAQLEIKLNGNDVNFTSEDIEGTGYWNPTETSISQVEEGHFVATDYGYSIDTNLEASDFDKSNMVDGGYMRAGYYSMRDVQVQLVLENSEGVQKIVNPTRTSSDSENRTADYSYNDIKTAWGSDDFSDLTKIYLKNNGISGAAAGNFVWSTLSWWDADPETTELQRHTISTGKTVTTDYMDLDLTSSGQEYNVITIKVKLPKVIPDQWVSEHGRYEDVYDYDLGESRTYTFRIKRHDSELVLGYGNTPYGCIMSSTTNTDFITSLKTKFDNEYNYRNVIYNPKAWWHSPDTTEADEVKRGTAPVGNQYVNYDKDETAIVVSTGQSFTDPGVTIHKEGSVVAPTTSSPVRRTITYKKVTNLKYANWPSYTEDTYTKNLTGAADDNVITLLKDENVVPGIYTINYEYSDVAGVPIKAHRYMIVLPKLDSSATPYKWDINMDNYINALDALIYNDESGIAKESDSGYTTNSEYLYRYRVLDVNNGRGDGSIDGNDEDFVINNGSAKILYPTIDITEPLNQQTYTVPSSPDTGKAQLYMDYLGKNKDTAQGFTTGADNTALATEELNKLENFYIGYRFTNTANLSTENVRELTLTVNYDQRYIQPVTTVANTLLSTHILPINPDLSKFDVKITPSDNYKVDNSTANITWNTKNDVSQVKTLKIQLYLKDGETFNLTDDKYFIKLPFRVVKVPQPDSRITISTQLGANTLNANIGNGTSYMWDGGYMWDTSSAPVHVTANLMTKLQYMGDFVPSFGPEDPPEELPDTVYGVETNYSGLALKGSIETAPGSGRTDETALPNGMLYEGNSGTISGRPMEVGDFIFYLNGVKYKIHVNKAVLNVTANNKEKEYGSANPALDFVYDSNLLKANGDWDEENNRPKTGVITTEPEAFCSADTTTDVTDDYPITFKTTTVAGEEVKIGEAVNYSFNYIDGKLKITPKPLTFSNFRDVASNSITAIPSALFKDIDVSSANNYDVDGLVNGDVIAISYNAFYTDTQSSLGSVSLPAYNRPVEIRDIKILNDLAAYPKGKNYKVANTTVPAANIGVITDSYITAIYISSPPKVEYTYGETLDLNTGRIKVSYDTGNVVSMTFLNAQRAGITLELLETDNTVASTPQHGQKLTVADSYKRIAAYIVNAHIDTSDRKQITDELIIHKKELNITANDKERKYGIANPTNIDLNATDNNPNSGNYSFTFDDTSEIVNSSSYIDQDGHTQSTPYGDTETSVRTEIGSHSGMLRFTCDTNADTEIDRTNGFTTADINLSADDLLANYKLVCKKGTMTINKRPITVKDLTDMKVLTSNYYRDADGNLINGTGPYYAPSLAEESSTALAGGTFEAGESASMTVTADGGSLGLYTRSDETEPDRIGVRYHAKYAILPDPLEDTENYPVTYVHKNSDGTAFEDGLVLDDDIGRSYNYVLTSATETGNNKGTVKERKIKNITIDTWLKTDYTYGTPTDYNTGDVTIEYDSGEKYEHITFKDIQNDHKDITLQYVDSDGNAVSTGVRHSNTNKDELDVKDSGKRIKLTVTTSRPTYQANDFVAYSPEFEITPHDLRVRANDVTTIYGTDIPEYTSGYGYTYTDSDFQYGDNETKLRTQTAVYVPPTVYCKDEHGINDVRQTTDSDTYVIYIKDTEAENYNVIETNGLLTIRQKAIIINQINGIPKLTAKDAHDMQTGLDISKTYKVKTEGGNLGATDLDGNATDVSIVFDENNKPIFSDWLTIKFRTNYADPRAIGSTDVNILDGAILKEGSFRNYYLHRIVSPQSGSIDDAIITDFEILFDPVYEQAADGSYILDESDNKIKKKYIYGDKLDLSTAKFRVTYDSTKKDTITFDKLSRYNITAYYTGTSTPVTDEAFVTIADFNNQSITFTLPSTGKIDPSVAGRTYTTDTFTVGKKALHIKIDDASYTYGDTPTSALYGYSFVAGDFAEGETDAVIPQTVKDAIKDSIKCTALTDENEQGKKLAVQEGGYEDTIIAVINDSTTNINDSIDNYYIPCDDDGKACDDSGITAGTMTVNKRTIGITAITDPRAIPTLTSTIAARYNYTVPIVLDGTATNTQLSIANLANSDDIEVTFKVRYNSLENNENADVDILNVAFKEDCPSKGNYDIDPATLVNAAKGKAYTRLLRAISVQQDPDHYEDEVYTYGDWLNMHSGKVWVEYDSGEHYEPKFDELDQYGIKAEFVKYDDTANDNAGAEVNDGVTRNAPTTNTLLTVPEHNGTRLKLTPLPDTAVEKVRDEYGNITSEDKVIVAYSNKTITVNKRDLKVNIEEQSSRYGDEPVISTVKGTDWSYDESDLVNGDTLESPRFKDATFSDPTVVCGKINDLPLGAYTDAGEYKELTISGGSSPNYNFVPNKGTLTINPRPIKIKSLNGVGAKNLTSDLIYQHRGEPTIVVEGNTAVCTYNNKDITFEDGYGVIFGDEIGITYSSVYDTADIATAGNKPVQVTIVPGSVEFDNAHPNNSNYYIDGVTTDKVTGGRVITDKVKSITLNADPTLRDDNGLPIAYKHGDAIDLNRGDVTIELDSGETFYNIKFNEVKSKTGGLVTIVYNDGEKDVEISDGDRLVRAKNNGVPLRLKAAGTDITEPETAPLSVLKAPMRVVADDTTKIYGDIIPKFTYKCYLGDDLYEGTNTDDFKNGFTAPSLVAVNDDDTPINLKSPVGEYEIKASDGECTNYDFIYESGTLTIEKRPLDVLKITKGIPELTSKIIYEQPGQYHALSGSATVLAGQVSLNNLSAGDDVKILYEALYSSTSVLEPAVSQKSDVVIANVRIDDEYGQGSNYVLRDRTSSSSDGNIYRKQIANVITVRQPRLSYTYGDTLDVTEKGVSIIYDDGSTVPNVAYGDLASYGITLKFIDNNGTETVIPDKETAAAIMVDVNTHSGAYYTLEAATVNNVPVVKTYPIVVNKKTLDINVHNATSIYGENHSEKFTFEYDKNDFVDGDYDNENNAPVSGVITTAPTFVCKDRGGNDVSERTSVGTYTIGMEGAESDNYKFVYNNGALTIGRRPLVITDIMKVKIPELSSKTIFEIEGEEHRLPSSAENEYMTFDANAYGDSLLTGDKVRVNFTAVYYSVTKNAKAPVGIEYNGMDDSYEQSGNYEVNTTDSVKRIEDGGVIYDREIERIVFDEQPVLDYTYGDSLNFEETGGKIHLYYDNTDDKVIDLKDYAANRLVIFYVDDTEGTNPKDAALTDKVSNLTNAGKHIQISVISAHTVDNIITEDDITVAKSVLEYGVCEVEPITYDGVTTLTRGTISFINPKNGDEVTAKGTFNFDSGDLTAGGGKTVHVTDITLDSPFDRNYSLPTTEQTATGTINKAKNFVSITADNLALSDVTNEITLTPPEMTATQSAGAAKYEYSKDGGNSWQDEPLFTDLTLGTEYNMCIRFAETDNYAQSDACEPVPITTYKVKMTLTSKDAPKEEGEDYRVLTSFYTNTEGAETEEDFRAFIGEITEVNAEGETVPVVYYELYEDIEGKTRVAFPVSFIDEGFTTADKTIYTTLIKKKTDGHSGGSTGGTDTPAVVIGFKDADGNETTSPTLTVKEGAEPLQLDADTSSIGKNITVVWTSDNPDIVSVDETGKLTFNGVGEATVTAEAKNKKNAGKDTLKITVVSATEPIPTTSPKPTTSPTPTTKPHSGDDKDKNIPYLHGFEGMIKPDDYMTRAEAATIMIQLMGDTGEKYENPFPDVREGTWYIDIIAQATARGLVTGFEDGTFRPEETVTREQFAAMVVKLANLDEVDEQKFSDVEPSRWSFGSVGAATKAGIVSGYVDGTFKPEDPTRRSEAVRMINVATGRIPDKELIDTLECPFSDLPKTHWAYYEFMIAAVEYEIP